MINLYDIPSKENGYCQENFTPFEDREIIPDLDNSEDFFNYEQQNSLYFLNAKDVNSEIIINDQYMTYEDLKLNQNSFILSQKGEKMPKEIGIILKTENWEMTTHTNKIKKVKKKGNQKENKKGNKHNLYRKAKKIIIDTALSFINNTISVVYEGKKGQGIFKKQLRKIEPFENQNTKVTVNLKLLNKTLKDIFSANINKKYTAYPLDINKKIIIELLNEKNEYRRKIFTDLFNKTFLDFLLMLKEPKIELKEIYEINLVKSIKKENESLNEIINIINNYEKEFNWMIPRKK